jgi:hypothetical protein
MDKTATLYHRNGHEETFDLDKIARMASCGQVGMGKDWSGVAPPPDGWEKIIPKYRVRFDVGPTALARFRLEPPQDMGANIWQYSDRDRVYKANEEITTKSWPHPSFVPLNYGAEKVLEFFNTRSKSRLTTSPWHIDRLRLDDGMTGTIVVIDVPPPPLKQIDRRAS